MEKCAAAANFPKPRTTTAFATTSTTQRFVQHGARHGVQTIAGAGVPGQVPNETSVAL
jgi:hypothetical protein